MPKKHGIEGKKQKTKQIQWKCGKNWLQKDFYLLN